MPTQVTIIKQGALLETNSHGAIDAAGVCLELCRRWIKRIMAKDWVAEDTIYDLINNETIHDLYAAHKDTNTQKHMNIAELDENRDAVREDWNRTRWRYAGLRSRDDVINHVLNAPGCYIYVATGSGNTSGHAFGFDTSDKALVKFMDPNQGEWVIANESDNNIRAWWRGFWEADDNSPLSPAAGGNNTRGRIHYKRAFHHGGRTLWRYLTPA